jgi:hypothetical protein
VCVLSVRVSKYDCVDACECVDCVCRYPWVIVAAQVLCVVVCEVCVGMIAHVYVLARM